MAGPVETKVSAAAIASATTGLGLWALQTYVFHGNVPLPVLAAMQAVVPAAVTFAAGYLAPHTPRPDLGIDPALDVAPGDTAEFAPEDLADARGSVVHTGDNSVDGSGRHALDDDPTDIPVSRLPRATRYDRPDR